MRIMFVLVLGILLTVGSTHAATYYVSTDGSDSNPGTFDLPFETIIQGAISAFAGDTVHVLPGNYGTSLDFPRSGSAQGGHIVYYSDPEDPARIQPGSFYGWSRSYIIVEGFRFLGSAPEQPAIEFHGSGSHVEIRNNEITGLVSQNSAAIRVGGFMHHFIIDGNHVHHNNTGNQEAIRVHEYTSDFEITRNEVNDNTNIGIDVVGWSQYGKPTRGLIAGNFAHNNATVAPWATGIYLDGPDSIIVEYNISIEQPYGFQLGCEPAADSSRGNIMRYNIAYDNEEYGMAIGGYSGSDVHHCLVYNNVFFNNHRELGFSTNPGHSNIIVNNIFASNNGGTITYIGPGPSDTIIDYNCYAALYGPTPGANSITSSPLFVNAGEYDFHLTSDSPCIDAGYALLEHVPDFDSIPTPLDGDLDGSSVVDIGAFEFVPEAYVEAFEKWRSRRPELNFFPNPSNAHVQMSLSGIRPGKATVSVYNLLGQLVMTQPLQISSMDGQHVSWNTSEVGSGTYIVRVQQGGESAHGRLIVLK